MFRIAFEAMASRCEVLLAAANEGAATALAQVAIDEVRRIEHKYSRYRADSVVGRINAQAGGAAVAVDAETAGLFDFADSLYAASAGRFDITSGVLRRAWNFREAVLPQAAQLEALLPLVDWRRVERDGGTVRLPVAGMELDVGGFGKEYAADRAAAILIERGARHGYVNLGGDLRVIGPMPDGAPWRIGIQDPRDPAATIASIEVASGALATSGDYERYIEVDGQRYCHILHPRTGWPVRGWRSVSVLAPLAIAAGGYATVAMLMEDGAGEFLDGAGLAWLGQSADGAIVSRQAVDK